MSTPRPMHSLAPGTYPRTGDLSPLGLLCREHASIVVGERCYWHTKRRWLEGEQVSTDALTWIGVDGANRPRSGGWRQPAQMPAWSRTDDLDQYDEPTSIPMWLRATTVRELEAET